jgi:transposase
MVRGVGSDTIARRSCPGAQLINDRFHVQQLMNEAVDQFRVRYRWEVLDSENKAIREYREKRKEAKLRGHLSAPWEPTKMNSGETMPQIMAHSKHIVLKHFSKWKEQQQIRDQILFETYPKLKKAYEPSMKLTGIFSKRISADSARLQLAKWHNEVEAFGEESFNAKIKDFRGQFRGMGDIQFFMYRPAMLYS